MSITDGKLREIGSIIDEYIYDPDRFRRLHLDIGRKAVELIRPLVLEEALSEPPNEECWKVGLMGAEIDLVIRLFSNRLAALTRKPDAAVEAVVNLLHDGQDVSQKTARKLCEEIVAAVRAADGKEKP